MGLPGRSALDLVSSATGAASLTLRLVEIPVPEPGSTPRGAHQHDTCEECIFVLAGTGCTSASGREQHVAAGDTILVPPGEPHVTHNTGTTPLLLLCFFPIPDITVSTKEPMIQNAPETP